MKKQLFSILIGLPVIGFSQITLDSADIIPNVGDTTGYYTMKDPHTIGAIAGPGSGASWDYSTMVIEDSAVIEFEAPRRGGLTPDPASTTIAEQFSGAFADRIQYKATSSDLYIVGTRSGITQTSYGKDSLLKFKFPVKYNDSYTTNIDVESGRIVKTYRKGSYKVTVDGEGKLILPYGELKNIMRVKVEMNYKDSSRFNQSTYSSTAYEYWQKGSISYAMKIEFIDEGRNKDTIVVYRKGEEVHHNPTGIATYYKNGSVLLYPNPASDILNVQADGLNELNAYKIFNILGETKFTGNLENGNQINIEELSVGMYFVDFEGTGLAPIRFIKK